MAAAQKSNLLRHRRPATKPASTEVLSEIFLSRANRYKSVINKRIESGILLAEIISPAYLGSESNTNGTKNAKIIDVVVFLKSWSRTASVRITTPKFIKNPA